MSDASVHGKERGSWRSVCLSNIHETHSEPPCRRLVILFISQSISSNLEAVLVSKVARQFFKFSVRRVPVHQVPCEQDRTMEAVNIRLFRLSGADLATTILRKTSSARAAGGINIKNSINLMIEEYREQRQKAHWTCVCVFRPTHWLWFSRSQ